MGFCSVSSRIPFATELYYATSEKAARAFSATFAMSPSRDAPSRIRWMLRSRSHKGGESRRPVCRAHFRTPPQSAVLRSQAVAVPATAGRTAALRCELGPQLVAKLDDNVCRQAGPSRRFADGLVVHFRYVQGPAADLERTLHPSAASAGILRDETGCEPARAMRAWNG